MIKTFLRSTIAMCMLCATHVTTATVIELGDLNIIDDAGNSSDGLRYLDMSFSDGLTSAGALIAAQASYANARLATPDEFDDLLIAAGIVSSPSASLAAFATGGADVLASNGAGTYDSGVLRDILGQTVTNQTRIWTDPDGDTDTATTRDYLQLSGSTLSTGQVSASPANSSYGWLIVSEATAVVPAPPSLVLSLLALACVAATRTRQEKTL